jgi:hypothetical protein
MAGEVRGSREMTVDGRRRSFFSVYFSSCRQKRLRLGLRLPVGNDGDGLSLETATVVLTPNNR